MHKAEDITEQFCLLLYLTAERHSRTGTVLSFSEKSLQHLLPFDPILFIFVPLKLGLKQMAFFVCSPEKLVPRHWEWQSVSKPAFCCLRKGQSDTEPTCPGLRLWRGSHWSRQERASVPLYFVLNFRLGRTNWPKRNSRVALEFLLISGSYRKCPCGGLDFHK